MNKKNIFSSWTWIYFVSRRFSSVDRKGRSAVTGFLAALGIALGVMTLITVLGVMNGFQMSFVDAIMEISSCHIQVSGVDDTNKAEFLRFCEKHKNIVAADGFYESQALITGGRGREASAIIRGVESGIMERDKGFAKELHIVGGAFDLTEADFIVLGSYLAQSLGVNIGGTVNLLAMSGGNDVALISQNREFRVTGIFECGYADINSSFAFISDAAAKANFGSGSQLKYGIKLFRRNADIKAAADIEAAFPNVKAQSWREFNRSFFGTLRIEKNILMLLVFLIFVVVGINIYNGMRRLVFERAEEISVLSALGASEKEIKSIFIMRGFTGGFIGSLAGTAAGLFLCVNIGSVFMGISHVMFFVEYVAALIFSPQNAAFIYENPMYRIYASIPARFYFSEVLAVSLFGLASPLFAALQASKNVLKMNVAEVLHDE